jgi:MOSC domain-containing protein YiiM
VRLGDPRFPKRFQTVGRHGAYLRVIEEGDVGAGDVVDVASRPRHGVTLGTMVRALREPAQARALRAIPRLPEFWQQVAAQR